MPALPNPILETGDNANESDSLPIAIERDTSSNDLTVMSSEEQQDLETIKTFLPGDIETGNSATDSESSGSPPSESDFSKNGGSTTTAISSEQQDIEKRTLRILGYIFWLLVIGVSAVLLGVLLGRKDDSGGGVIPDTETEPPVDLEPSDDMQTQTTPSPETGADEFLPQDLGETFTYRDDPFVDPAGPVTDPWDPYVDVGDATITNPAEDTIVTNHGNTIIDPTAAVADPAAAAIVNPVAIGAGMP